MNGVINVNKPLGMTSHDVVYKLRRLLSIKKIVKCLIGIQLHEKMWYTVSKNLFWG